MNKALLRDSAPSSRTMAATLFDIKRQTYVEDVHTLTELTLSNKVRCLPSPSRHFLLAAPPPVMLSVA